MTCPCRTPDLRLIEVFWLCFVFLVTNSFSAFIGPFDWEIFGTWPDGYFVTCWFGQGVWPGKRETIRRRTWSQTSGFVDTPSAWRAIGRRKSIGQFLAVKGAFLWSGWRREHEMNGKRDFLSSFWQFYHEHCSAFIFHPVVNYIHSLHISVLNTIWQYAVVFHGKLPLHIIMLP